MNQQQSARSRSAAPGEVIYAEGFVGTPALYVIADGKVELSTQCDEKRVVLATLGKGDFFGEEILTGHEPRTSTAKALTFCKLSVIEPQTLDSELEGIAPLLRHMLRTLIRRAKRKDELLAAYSRADFLPGVVSYAHLLALMGATVASDDRTRRSQSDTVSLSLTDVVSKCRAVAGHSRVHVVTMLRRMEKLNLLKLDGGRPAGSATRYASHADDESTARQRISFDPVTLIERAHQVAGEEMDVAIASELELIDLDDLESLVGVKAPLLLSKISRGEVAEDVFAFRKSRVLHYIEQKGVQYFTKAASNSLAQLASLADLDLVDARTLFEVTGTFDTYDLAKLLAGTGDATVTDRLLSVMTEARRNELTGVMRREIKVDPIEAQDIERRFIDRIKALKATAILAAAQ